MHGWVLTDKVEFLCFVPNVGSQCFVPRLGDKVGGKISVLQLSLAGTEWRV